MTKQLLLAALLICSSLVYSQQNSLVFKKGNKTISRFWLGSFFAFQSANDQWQKGQLTRIQNDSFYIRPMVVHYNMMGSDTTWYEVIGFALNDVVAMPKKGILIDYIDGRFQISRSGGHVHWYWIKSGLVFRIGAAGYAAMDVTNGLVHNNFTFEGSKLGIAAGAFLFGVLLKHTYKPVLSLNRKYHLETFRVAN